MAHNSEISFATTLDPSRTSRSQPVPKLTPKHIGPGHFTGRYCMKFQEVTIHDVHNDLLQVSPSPPLLLAFPPANRCSDNDAEKIVYAAVQMVALSFC